MLYRIYRRLDLSTDKHLLVPLRSPVERMKPSPPIPGKGGNGRETDARLSSVDRVTWPARASGAMNQSRTEALSRPYCPRDRIGAGFSTDGTWCLHAARHRESPSPPREGSSGDPSASRRPFLLRPSCSLVVAWRFHGDESRKLREPRAARETGTTKTDPESTGRTEKKEGSGRPGQEGLGCTPLEGHRRRHVGGPEDGRRRETL